MDLINVDNVTCNHDGLCAEICPMSLITMGEDEIPRPTADADSLCVRCGHCVAVCPTGSLHHKDINEAACPEINRELFISLGQCEQYFRSRRSIRHFWDRQVEKGVLQKLIEIARYAPTGHNSQGVEWLVLGDREELNNMAGLVCDWMGTMLDLMPDFARSLSMDRVIERYQSGEDPILRGAPVVVVTHGKKDDRRAQTSCTIAMTHLELIAPSLGLGCCWAGFFNAAAANYPELEQALGLPDGNTCYGAMMIGYPKYRFKRLVERKMPTITWRLPE